MKKIVLLIFIFTLRSYGNYATPSTGVSWTMDSLVAHSSGDVTTAGGVYFVNDTITVSLNDTLKIFTNSTIKLASLVLINVDGTLKANPPNQIIITAQDTTQMFYGFRFSDYSDASVLKKVTFQYGSAIKLVNSDMLIDSCTIRFNTLISNFSTSAINLTSSNPVISNNTIYRNGRSAIGSAANLQSSPTIINNQILENDVSNGLYPQINLGGSSASPLIIRNNIISGFFNQAGGIAIFPVGVSVPNCIIEGNVIRKNSYGIVLYNTPINALIINNVIDSNNINPNPLAAGSGINVNGNTQNVSIISRNKIRGNLWGITIQGTALPDLGNINNSDTTDNGRNQIYGNGHSDSIIDLYNNTPDTIYAQNNYWGTTNLDSIEAHIVHHPDNPALGWVIYQPILSLTGITPNASNLPSTFRLYDAYPNPFNPETKITFSVPSGERNSGPLQLIIYDALGREAVTLINGRLEPGQYSVTWNAVAFSSGVYFYRLVSKNASGESAFFSETKKLILLK